MVRWKRSELLAEARRRNLEQSARLSGELRESRRRRRLTQKQLGERVGLVQSAISDIERGHGGGYSLDAWQSLFLALDRPLLVDARRDPQGELRDASHLAIQELILRGASSAGFSGTFELPVRPGLSRHSVDVFLRSDERRLLVVCEAWNSFGDLGAGVRSFAWKLGQAEQLATALPGEEGYAVRGCWVIRATIANRGLIRRYPSIFSTRFPGSSLAWWRALTSGCDPPAEPGLVWCDRGAERLFPVRRT
jgi:transcriptional regulator with XRE-family HTH domain